MKSHLNGHLEAMLGVDPSSEAVLQQMAMDEASHADFAETAGARALPEVSRCDAMGAALMKGGKERARLQESGQISMHARIVAAPVLYLTHR